MNIAFLLRLWPVYGGGETVTICLANEMVKRGWNVSVLYFKNNMQGQFPFIDPAISAIQITDIQCDEFTNHPQDGNKVTAYLKDYVAKNNIDYIINQWWPVEYIKGIKGYSKTKVITCLHQALYAPTLEGKGIKGFLKKKCTGIYKFFKKKYRIRRVKSFFPHVDKYVFLSPSFLLQYKKFAKYSDEKQLLVAIPNPLVYTEEILPNDLKSKEKTVLLVGRMVEGQKRITRAIEIWNHIEKDPDLTDWNLQIVGDGPDLALYKKITQSLRLERISFEGYQNPFPYYKRATIFMMTSAFEGFGMTLIEAQQCGAVPIVMDSFLSLHDIIQDGYNGIIVPDGDNQTYVYKLKKIMTDDFLREKLVLNGLNSCKKFSIKHVLDKWEQLFVNLSDNKL